MINELYKKYRPRSLKTFVGQNGAVLALRRMMEKDSVPHALLFTGPSGTGKTTIGRMLKEHLKCSDFDFVEINAADFKGIDTIRDIRRTASMMPMEGSCRIWLIDEAGKLTNDAQNAFLKILEDTPDHAYFFLATTDPQKLLKTIHTRCTEIKLQGLSHKELEQVIVRVAKKESMTLTDEVIQAIIESSDSSARKALVILEQVGWLETEKEQLEAVVASSVHKDKAIELARALIQPNARWPQVAAILKELKDEPEQVRYLVLGYCRSVMLGGGGLAARAFDIVDIFSSNFYDSKQAGLAAACWEVLHFKRK